MINPSYSSIGDYTKYKVLNKLTVDIAAALWLARQSIYEQEFKTENSVKIKKNKKEAVNFPYAVRFKQSNKSNCSKIEWKYIAFALSQDIKLWYKNTIINVEPKVEKELNIRINLNSQP